MLFNFFFFGRLAWIESFTFAFTVTVHTPRNTTENPVDTAIPHTYQIIKSSIHQSKQTDNPKRRQDPKVHFKKGKTPPSLPFLTLPPCVHLHGLFKALVESWCWSYWQSQERRRECIIIIITVIINNNIRIRILVFLDCQRNRKPSSGVLRRSTH